MAAIKKFVNDASHPPKCSPTGCPICRTTNEDIPQDTETVKCCEFDVGPERVEVHAPMSSARMMHGPTDA